MELRRMEKIYRAFSDSTRIRILNIMITGKEFCVEDIQEVLNEGQSKVSRHLSSLVSSALVVREKRGKYNYYYLKKKREKEEEYILYALRKTIENEEWAKKDIESILILDKKKAE